jgi:hypothetical protein
VPQGSLLSGDLSVKSCIVLAVMQHVNLLSHTIKNIVNCDAYMQYVIHNVESSSMQHHRKTRSPTNLISSAQLG